MKKKMKSGDQNIDVGDEERFDDLIKLHKEIKKFKKEECAEILSNFHVEKFKMKCGSGGTKSYQKFQLNKLVGKDYELQLNLSSTTVCTYVLSQYSDIWGDKKQFGDITKCYTFIIDGLKKCTSNETCVALSYDYKEPEPSTDSETGLEPSTDSETGLEPIDEFSLLNILALLKNIKDENDKELIDNEKREIILEIVRILCKQFVIKEIPSFRKGEEKHPFIFYKFLCMILDWDEMICKDIHTDSDRWKTWAEEEKFELKKFVGGVKTHDSVFKCFFDEIYTDAKYEIYRQLSLYHASDFSLFDVKRLIYGLLIVKLKGRYSNELVVKKALDLIFKTQYKTTGLLPICHGVNSDFYMENGEIREEYKNGVIISGSPVLSSIECLSDMLGHEDIELDDKYYEKLKITYDWISNRIIKEGKTKIGWYPEYERDRTPKSWTTGHTLIFLKRYCKGVSKLIEKEASKSVSSEDSAGFIDWDDLADSYGLKKIVEKYIINEIDEEKGLKYRSMILFGPPGSGKSTVGKALAKELKWGYVEVTPGLFLDEGDHKIISKINRVFKRLVRLRKKVIFFDEVDRLVASRKEGEERSQWIVTSILPKLSELRGQDDIIFILATNHPENVDDAIMRLGRIDFVLPVGAISWRYRLKILKNKLKWAKKERDTSTTIYQSIESMMEFDEHDVEKEIIIQKPRLRRYLERTNFVSFVQIDLMLEEMFSGDRQNIYKIFFECEECDEYIRFIDGGFEKFEKKFKEYSRLPLGAGIKEYIKDAAF